MSSKRDFTFIMLVGIDEVLQLYFNGDFNRVTPLAYPPIFLVCVTPSLEDFPRFFWEISFTNLEGAGIQCVRIVS